jgi:hypothetical protein
MGKLKGEGAPPPVQAAALEQFFGPPKKLAEEEMWWLPFINYAANPGLERPKGK